MGGHLIYVVQDREKWRALVNMAKKKHGEFLD